MNDVVERLERLSPAGTAGDWVDVLDRTARQRRVQRRRRGLIGLGAAILLAVPALALAYRFTDILVVASTDARPPVPWVAGDRVFNFGGSSERRLRAPLARSTDTSMYFFDFSPATPSADGRQLLYTAAEPGDSSRRSQLVLRVHDFSTGADRVLERGAGSAAWRADGALGYVAGIVGGPMEPSDPIGHVFVRRSLSDPAARWTTETARYTAIAWARDHLIVAALAAGEHVPATGEGVYALSGPGRARKLPLGGVVAVDPSGDFVVGPETIEPFLAGSLNFRVVRVRDGAILDQLDLPPIIDPKVPYAAGQFVTGGSWAGDYIVVAASGPPADALVLLRFANGQLSPAHVFRLEARSAARAGFAALPWSAFGNPRFVDDRGDEIVAWATTTTREGGTAAVSRVFLVCSRTKKECHRTDPLPGLGWSIRPSERGSPYLQHAFVENLSRPLPSP
jgi:hypothetical protein